MSSAYSDAMGSDGIDFNELRRKVAEAKRLADKPAATGSGEPCWHKDIDEQGFCRKCGVRAAIKLSPTPPASQPTVTLDRETFDRLISKAESLKSDLLALLRAAEQK